MEHAVPYRDTTVTAFDPPAAPSSTPATVVLRDGRLQRDNGVCRDTATVQLFVTAEPRTADCKPNEVDVPDVTGATLAAAKERLAGQPLLARVAEEPAEPGQRVGIVIRQEPSKGTLSAYDKVTIVVRKATKGVVPRVLGLTVAKAQAQLAAVKADVKVNGGSAGRVVAQSPRPGRAAAPGMRVVLVVRSGTGG
jgi:beta-lactam-binding protein with PASTA domain